MPRAENQSAARRCTVSSSAGSSLRVCSLRNDENSVWYLNQLSSESRQRRNRPERSRNSRMLRSEEHTSELQSLMRISYAVFCLKHKINNLNRLTTPKIQYHILHFIAKIATEQS